MKKKIRSNVICIHCGELLTKYEPKALRLVPSERKRIFNIIMEHEQQCGERKSEPESGYRHTHPFVWKDKLGNLSGMVG